MKRAVIIVSVFLGCWVWVVAGIWGTNVALGLATAIIIFFVITTYMESVK